MAFPNDPRLLKANTMQAPANEWSISENPHPEPKHPGNPHPEPRHDPQKLFIQPTPTSKMSSTPSTGEASTFDKKPVLSDEQRKANHTSSETNRRNRIKAWYWDLCQLVPDLQEKAPENCRRERLVMDQTREFSRATMVRRNQLIDALEAQGRDPGKELGLTRFEILPPIDPKAIPKSDDDTIEEEEGRDDYAAEDADDPNAQREGQKPPRKRRRRNNVPPSAIFEGQ
ncbi:hypothetical protein XANCAGTX0491_008986 [Xanthoria calcicola]